MKIARNLSGIYFRYLNPIKNKYENRCFEDLPEIEQNKYMNDKSKEWLKSLAKTLANTLNEIGEDWDLIKE